MRDHITLKLDIACSPDFSGAPTRIELELDKDAAHRLRNNTLFVAENEKRAGEIRDEIDCADFMCAAPVEFFGGSNLFVPAGIRFRCYTGMFCIAMYDKHDGSAIIETELFSLRMLEKKMKWAGWLRKGSE